MRFLILFLCLYSPMVFGQGAASVVDGDLRFDFSTKPVIFTPVWGSFPVSGAGAVNKGYWYRDGSHMIINISGNTGASFVGGGIMSMTIPRGYKSDGRLYTGGGNNANTAFGSMFVVASNGGAYMRQLKIKLTDGGGTTLSFTEIPPTAAATSVNFQATNVDASTPFSLNASIPIYGW